MKIALIYDFELNNYDYMQGKANISHLSPKIVVELLLYSPSKLFQTVDWKINSNKKKAKEKRT